MMEQVLHLVVFLPLASFAAMSGMVGVALLLEKVLER